VRSGRKFRKIDRFLSCEFQTRKGINESQLRVLAILNPRAARKDAQGRPRETSAVRALLARRSSVLALALQLACARAFGAESPLRALAGEVLNFRLLGIHKTSEVKLYPACLLRQCF
jgi:hypothetical protein